MATPAPKMSATWVISSRAPRAPWPTKMATLDPALRMSAAWRIAPSSGAAWGQLIPRLEGTILKACSGGS